MEYLQKLGDDHHVAVIEGAVVPFLAGQSMQWMHCCSFIYRQENWIIFLPDVRENELIAFEMCIWMEATDCGGGLHQLTYFHILFLNRLAE